MAETQDVLIVGFLGILAVVVLLAAWLRALVLLTRRQRAREQREVDAWRTALLAQGMAPVAGRPASVSVTYLGHTFQIDLAHEGDGRYRRRVTHVTALHGRPLPVGLQVTQIPGHAVTIHALMGGNSLRTGVSEIDRHFIIRARHPDHAVALMQHRPLAAALRAAISTQDSYVVAMDDQAVRAKQNGMIHDRAVLARIMNNLAILAGALPAPATDSPYSR